AYLTKEAAIFIVPALIISSLLQGSWRAALCIAMGTAGVVALEFSWYLLTSGDLLFRLHAMGPHNTGMLHDPTEIISDLHYRLFKAYPRMMLVPNREFGLHSLIMLVSGISALALLGRDRRSYFLVLWAIVPWLYLNFGSSSLSSYIPLPLGPR